MNNGEGPRPIDRWRRLEAAVNGALGWAPDVPRLAMAKSAAVDLLLLLGAAAPGWLFGSPLLTAYLGLGAFFASRVVARGLVGQSFGDRVAQVRYWRARSPRQPGVLRCSVALACHLVMLPGLLVVVHAALAVFSVRIAGLRAHHADWRPDPDASPGGRVRRRTARRRPAGTVSGTPPLQAPGSP